MRERYVRVFTGEPELYAEGSPVIIKAHVLLRDNNNGNAVAQLKYQNVTEKNIKYIKIKITCFDALNNVIEPSNYFEYDNVSVDAYELFGSDKPLNLLNPSTHSYNVCVIGATFESGEIWIDEYSEWHSDTKMSTYADLELKYKTAVKMMNSSTTEPEYQQALNMFEELGQFKNSDNLKSACYTKVYELRGKKKKIRNIIIILLSALLLASIIVGVNVYRNSSYYKYSEAKKLIGSKDYETIYKAFNELDDYKDSKSILNDCVVEWAEYAISNPYSSTSGSFAETVIIQDTMYYAVYDIINQAILSQSFDNLDGANNLKCECIRNLLSVLPDTYKNVSDLKQVFNDIIKRDLALYNKSYIRNNMDLLERLWEYDFIKEYLQDDLSVCVFFEGLWNSEDSEDYYFKFYEDASGSTSVSYNLPHVVLDNAMYYTITDMEFCYQDIDDNKIAKVYTFEMINFNEMNVYCEKNGKTYTMHREVKK